MYLQFSKSKSYIKDMNILECVVKTKTKNYQIRYKLHFQLKFTKNIGQFIILL